MIRPHHQTHPPPVPMVRPQSPVKSVRHIVYDVLSNRKQCRHFSLWARILTHRLETPRDFH